MNRLSIVRVAMASLLVTGLVACSPSKRAQRKADSVASAVAQQKVISQAGEVMGARQEAQALLDSARSAVASKQNGAAAKELRDAAAFTRMHGDSAAEPAKTEMLKAATELDALATNVERGSVKTPAAFSHAFAAVHIAEAQLHCTRALAAWKENNSGATAAEMMMLADHFERAAVDGGLALTPAAKGAVATLREVGTKLTEHAIVAAPSVQWALEAMDKEVHGLAATIEKSKR